MLAPGLSSSALFQLTESFLQGIFLDYKQPFAVTYLGASLMVVYLPIAFLKDWFCNFLKRRSSKSGKNAESMNDFSAGFSSPLKYNGGQKIFESELQGCLTRKDSEADLSPHAEGRPLVTRHKDDAQVLKHDRELTAKEIAKYGFYIAPIWFVTEVRHFLGWFLQNHLQFFFWVIWEAVNHEYYPLIH